MSKETFRATAFNLSPTHYARVIDGSKIAKQILADLQLKVANFVNQYGNKPTLVAIKVGNNPASNIYIQKKLRACDSVGMLGICIPIMQYDEQLIDEELVELINKFNADDSIHGIILQLPLPLGMDSTKYTRLIDPKKDVDVFHPFNVGLLSQNKPYLKPCTPAGIQVLLSKSNINVSGKHIVIINRSNIVGKPLSTMFIQDDEFSNATVTVCHDKTPPELLKQLTLAADIIVVAVGKPNFLTKDMISTGCGIVDVGINRFEDKIVGDCHPDVKDIADWITPVPGGVGPMTVAMLLENTLEAAKFSKTF